MPMSNKAAPFLRLQVLSIELSKIHSRTFPFGGNDHGDDDEITGGTNRIDLCDAGRADHHLDLGLASVHDEPSAFLRLNLLLCRRPYGNRGNRTGVGARAGTDRPVRAECRIAAAGIASARAWSANQHTDSTSGFVAGRVRSRARCAATPRRANRCQASRVAHPAACPNRLVG